MKQSQKLTLILAPFLFLSPLTGLGQVRYWDGENTSQNGVVDGGDGSWNNSTTNWTNADGSQNFTWAGRRAVFEGSQGIVTVDDAVDFTGLDFRTDGYLINAGTGALNALGNAEITVVGDETTSEISASINGAGGGLIKLGEGTLILSGTNAYDGNTDHREGTLLVGDGALGSGILRLHDGTTFGGNAGGAWVTNDISILGNVDLIPAICGCSLELEGRINLGLDTRVLTIVEAGDVYFDGPIIGEGGLTLLSDVPTEGFFTMSGNEANAYKGPTTVGDFTALFLEKDAGVTAIAGNLWAQEEGVVVLVNDDQIGDTSAVQIDGILDLGMSAHEKIGALYGDGIIENDGFAFELEVGEGFFNGTIEECGCATISLTKYGPGTLTLANTNDYSGLTFVHGGTLVAAADYAFGSSIVLAANAGTTLQVNQGVDLNNIVALLDGATLDNSGTMEGALFFPAVLGAIDTHVINRGSGVMQSTGLPAVVTFLGGTITNKGLITTGGDLGDVIEGIGELGELEDIEGLIALFSNVDPDDLDIAGITERLETIDPEKTESVLTEFVTLFGDIDPEDMEGYRLPGIVGILDTTIVNKGTIEGGEYAIVSLGGTNLSNSGTIVGSVYLGSSANTVTLRTGGVIQGDLAMGDNLDNKLRLGGSGTQLLSAAVTGDITGFSMAEKIGSGTWIVDENNALPNGLLISKGRLQIGNGGNIGSVESTIVNNAELAFDRAGTYSYNNIVTGAGRFVQAGDGTLILSNNNTTTGGALVESGTLQMGNGGGAGSFLGDVIVQSGATFAINRAGKLSFNQSVSGAGNFRKMGGNKLMLGGTNSYTGRTYIDGGRLIVSTKSLPKTSNVKNKGTLEFHQNFDGTYKGKIRGGDLTKLGRGKVILTGKSTKIDDTRIKQGTLAVNGVLKSEDIIIEEKGTLAGSGKIVGDITNHGTIAPGNSPGYLVVDGNLTLANTSEVDMEIAGTKNNQFDRIKVKGTARLNGSLRVFLLGGFVPDAGAIFTFLEAGRIKGKFRETDLSATLDMDVVYNSDSVDIVFGPDRLPYQTFARGSNQYNVAVALEKLRTRDLGEGGDFDNHVRPVLDSLPADWLRAAFEASMPAQSVAFADSVFARSRTFLPQMQTRLADIREGARGFQASGMQITQQGASDMKDVLAPAPENKWGVWVDGSGVFNQIASFENLGRGQGTSAAATVGVDYRLSDNFTIGFYTGYVGTWTNFGGGSEIDSNGTRFGLYSTYKNGGFYLNNVVGGEWNSYDWERRINFPGISRTASADTNGTVFETMFGGGYDWDISNSFKLGLFSSIEYTLLCVDGFTESGARSLNLRVNDQDADSLRSNVGAQAMWTLPIGTRTLRPSLRAAWRHEYLDGSRRINSALVGGAGPAFSTRLPGTNRKDSLLLNGGFSLDLTDDVSGYVYYTGDLSGGTTDNIHSVNAGLRVQF